MNTYQLALKRLYEYGWCKGDRQNDRNQRCMIGALVEENFNGEYLGYGNPLEYEKEIELIAKTILETYPQRMKRYAQKIEFNKYLNTCLVQWFNDHPRTSFEDVVNVLENIINKNQNSKQMSCVARC